MPESYQAIFRRRSVASAATTTKKHRLMIDSRMNVDVRRPAHQVEQAEGDRRDGGDREHRSGRRQKVVVVREIDDRRRCDEKNVVPALRRQQRHQRQKHCALDPFRERHAAPAEEHERDDAEQ